MSSVYFRLFAIISHLKKALPIHLFKPETPLRNVDLCQFFCRLHYAQCVRLLAPQAEGWVFESQPRVSRVLGDDHYKQMSRIQ